MKWNLRCRRRGSKRRRKRSVWTIIRLFLYLLLELSEVIPKCFPGYVDLFLVSTWEILFLHCFPNLSITEIENNGSVTRVLFRKKTLRSLLFTVSIGFVVEGIKSVSLVTKLWRVLINAHSIPTKSTRDNQPRVVVLKYLALQLLREHKWKSVINTYLIMSED